MEIDEFNKLEKKIKSVVNSLKETKDENRRLNQIIEDFKKESSCYDEERVEIKKKVTTLIELIDSIEK